MSFNETHSIYKAFTLHQDTDTARQLHSELLSGQKLHEQTLARRMQEEYGVYFVTSRPQQVLGVQIYPYDSHGRKDAFPDDQDMDPRTQAKNKLGEAADYWTLLWTALKEQQLDIFLWQSFSMLPVFIDQQGGLAIPTKTSFLDHVAISAGDETPRFPAYVSPTSLGGDGDRFKDIQYGKVTVRGGEVSTQDLKISDEIAMACFTTWSFFRQSVHRLIEQVTYYKLPFIEVPEAHRGKIIIDPDQPRDIFRENEKAALEAVAELKNTPAAKQVVQDAENTAAALQRAFEVAEVG